MYLEARKYVSKFEDLGVYEAMLESAPEGIDKYAEFGGASMSYPVGYWRKANAIHGWFVRECGGGIDECQPIHVPREKLIELRDACKSVLSVSVGARREDVAAQVGLLPTQGFFFGSYEMDEWYFADLKQTVEMLDHILSVVPDDGGWAWEFIYRASW